VVRRDPTAPPKHRLYYRLIGLRTLRIVLNVRKGQARRDKTVDLGTLASQGIAAGQAGGWIANLDVTAGTE